SIRTERPHADDGIAWIGVHVGDRAEHDVDADLAGTSGEFGAGRGGGGDVVERAEQRGAGKRRSGGDLEAGDAAALLVYADQSLRIGLVDPGAQQRKIIGDVLAEVDDSRQVMLEGVTQPRRRVFSLKARAEEARPQHAVGEADEVVGHPFTAPATRPDDRRRCTMMKKIMTGTVMMVDAAMMLPQSLEYCPKNDFRPIATVYWSVAPPSSVMAKMNSFHAVMKLK